jgi:hypothetical protein
VRRSRPLCPSSVTVNAAKITQNAPVNITGALNIVTDTAAINNTLTVGGITSIVQRSFRPINLGAAADSGSALDLSAAELNNVVTPVLRIGNFSSGALSIVNSVAPANAGTLALTSGISIGQSPSATLTHANVAMNAPTINLPEANNVTTLAGTANGFGGQFLFANAAGTPLSVGSVDGKSGVRFTGGNGSINLTTDALGVMNPIQAFGNPVTIQPRTAGDQARLGRCGRNRHPRHKRGRGRQHIRQRVDVESGSGGHQRRSRSRYQHAHDRSAHSPSPSEHRRRSQESSESGVFARRARERHGELIGSG